STGSGGHGTITPVFNPVGNNFGGPVYVLPACMSEDAACSADSDCCSGMTCSENSKTCVKPLVVPPVRLPSCTPTGYADGRAAVPLVVTAFKDAKDLGPKARFVESTPFVTMNDVISFIRVSRGPNYVKGDKVRIYSAANYVNTQAYADLEP